MLCAGFTGAAASEEAADQPHSAAATTARLQSSGAASYRHSCQQPGTNTETPSISPNINISAKLLQQVKDLIPLSFV